MKEKTKATIGSALLAGTLLTGCSDVITNGEIDLPDNSKNNIEHTEVVNRSSISEYKQVYEPGTHFIQYYSPINLESINKDDYLNTNIPVIEGYELSDIQPFISKYLYGSKTYGYVYIFVNTEKVEVTMHYDYKNNVVFYNEPGVVVKEQTLK